MAPLTLATYLDIAIHPDFAGLPVNVTQGLVHLTDNLAALLLVLSGVGIVVSILGLLVASWLGSHHLGERFRSSLILSTSSGALLFVAAAAANYATTLFR